MAHNHHPAHGIERRLRLSLLITIGIFLAELLGGLMSRSLALLSDAGHVLTDSFALGLSLVAVMIARRPSNRHATFGYHRVGLLAAIINGASLVAIALYIFGEAWQRFMDPPGIDLSIMLPVALAGLLANAAMIYILGHGVSGDLNLKSAWLHVVGDTLASVGVIASGAIIYFTGWLYADPLVSVLIGCIIIAGGLRVVREALHVFLDLVPRGFDLEGLTRSIASVPGVIGLHDVHLRALTHGRVEFTAHVHVEAASLEDAGSIRLKIERLLAHMGVAHSVLQMEHAPCPEGALYCTLRPEGPVGPHAHGHDHGRP